MSRREEYGLGFASPSQVREMARAVEWRFEALPGAVVSPSRLQPAVKARKAVAMVLRDGLRCSYTRIGILLNRDPKSAHFLVREGRALAARDRSFRRGVSRAARVAMDFKAKGVRL